MRLSDQVIYCIHITTLGTYWMRSRLSIVRSKRNIFYLQMKVLMDSYARIKKVHLNSLVFEFDGDFLTGMETPRTLELDGGECIDVYEAT